MTHPNVQHFINALHNLEDSHEMKEMLGLFSEACEISNVAIKPLHGKQGALRFWKDYLATFKEVHTEFKSVTETERKVFLEWVSRGLFQSGRPAVYEGLYTATRKSN